MVARVPAQDLLHGSAHVRVQVHGVEEQHLGMPRGQLRNRPADRLEARPEILPAVARDQDDLPQLRVCGQAPLQLRDRGRCLPDLLQRQQQRVDDRVARHEDGLRRHPLPEEVVPADLRRREVQPGQVCRQYPVHLFRPGRQLVAGPEPGLDMAHGDPMIEGGQRRRKDRCRVALHQDQVGLFLREVPVQSENRGHGEACQGLVRAHEVQVRIGLDVEGLQDLVEHLPVLGGDADPRLEPAGPLQFADDRGQLDRFRPCAEYD